MVICRRRGICLSAEKIMKIYHGNMQTKRYMSFGRENYEDLPWKYADEEAYVFRQREL
jgi:hypothetical protein